MENTAKKYGKVLSFTPIVLFTLWTIYYTIININTPFPARFEDHIAIMTNTIANYSLLFIFLAIICTITAGILLYFTVHIARLKHMTAGEKIAWMVFMVCFGAFSFPVFWYYELRNEPQNIDVYTSIA